MRLKSLKLAGFKSFANPTTFTFRHGITAIVGPNGCGKSNVIDAIRWVLGESSAKQLRGGAMSDVIFAGTQDKAAKSMASVELTFEHTQDESRGIRHELNLYHELSIRRQINLEGRSDYFINGTRCRRRDVIDVFLGTGLGSRSYAVIEQGMIGRIVDSSPMQLREFVEEAAGVSRYQARREETQKKLETTQENLARLDDIRSELARRQKTLAKQAESAQTYQALKDELNEVQQKLAITQLRDAKLQELAAKAEQEQLTQQLKVSTGNMTTLKAKLSKLASRISEAQWLKDDAQERYHQGELACQQASYQLTSLQDKLSQSERRLGSLQSQLELSHAEAEGFREQQSEQQAKLETLTPQVAELEHQLSVQQKSQAPLEASWQALQTQINEIQSQIRQHEQQQALHKQAQQQLKQQQDKWQHRETLWHQQAAESGLSVTVSETTALTVNLSAKENVSNQTESTEPSLTEQIQQMKASLGSIHRQREDLEDSQAAAQPKLNELAQTLAAQQKSQQVLEKRHATLSGEYDSLHRMLHPPKPAANNTVDIEHDEEAESNSGSNSSNDRETEKSTAQLAVQLKQLPKLSEQIELSSAGKPLANVLDYWLALWLNSSIGQSAIIPVSNNTDESNLTSDWLPTLLALKPEAKSSTEMLVNSILFSLQHNVSQSNIDQKATTFQVPNATPLSQLITKPNLAIWHQCYLYTADLAVNLLDETTVKVNKDALQATIQSLPKGAILLTATGWLINQCVAVHLSKLTGKGDSASQSQFLTQRLQQSERLAVLEASLTQLEDELDAVSQSIKTTQSQYDELNVTAQELTAQATTLTHLEHQQQQQLTVMTAQLDRLQAEQARLQAERLGLDNDYQELADAQAELTQQIQSIEALLAEQQPQFEALQRQLEQLSSEREQQRNVIQANLEKLQHLRFEIKEATLAANHAKAQLNKSNAQQEQLTGALQAAERQFEQSQVKLPELKAAQKAADMASHEQQVALEEYKASLTTLMSEHSSHQKQLDDMATEIESQQAQLADYTTQVAIFGERIRDASERLEAIGSDVSASTILTEIVVYGEGHARRLGQGSSGHAEVAESAQQLHQLEAQLAAKLERMGAVNLAAVAELEEVNARLMPLEQQIEDIAASMATLTDAIATIDTKTKALFMQTLEAVNDDMASLFAKVFGGGQAKLSLQDDDSLARADKWRAGIELMAQPKGKRNSRLAVLSGGEKTLTALSLIFAIFKQHPAPFCVLDEVDAPLDDANVARFTSLIHELADEVQFIFISHNKLAMQIADELKGITMPQAGVSTLVSVSLEEAERYIDA
ncbi:MAG: AAA family ATPase [Psychrobacter sp.]|nr:AAA family ATPase [Psychrobacter sp.]